MYKTSYINETIDDFYNIFSQDEYSEDEQYIIDHFEIRLADSIIKEFGESFAEKLGQILISASMDCKTNQIRRNGTINKYPRY